MCKNWKFGKYQKFGKIHKLRKIGKKYSGKFGARFKITFLFGKLSKRIYEYMNIYVLYCICICIHCVCICICSAGWFKHCQCRTNKLCCCQVQTNTHNFGVTINVSLTVSCESGYRKFERWKVKLQNNSREFPRNGTLAGYCSLNKQTVWASVSDRNVRKVGQWVRTTTIKQQKQQQQKQQQRQQQQQN